jgi:RNA polymerase sigma-54 factor
MNSGKAKEFIQDKMRSAVWLIRSIHQRQRTIYKVTESIVKFQRDFFDQGIAHLKPLHPARRGRGHRHARVHRLARDHQQVRAHAAGHLRAQVLLQLSIGCTGGDEIASEAVKSHIKSIVAQEDGKSPYSDQKIVELLKAQGIEIARRTVAKYRESAGHPAVEQAEELLLGEGCRQGEGGSPSRTTMTSKLDGRQWVL